MNRSIARLGALRQRQKIAAGKGVWRFGRRGADSLRSSEKRRELIFPQKKAPRLLQSTTNRLNANSCPPQHPPTQATPPYERTDFGAKSQTHFGAMGGHSKKGATEFEASRWRSPIREYCRHRQVPAPLRTDMNSGFVAHEADIAAPLGARSRHRPSLRSIEPTHEMVPSGSRASSRAAIWGA